MASKVLGLGLSQVVVVITQSERDLGGSSFPLQASKPGSAAVSIIWVRVYMGGGKWEKFQQAGGKERKKRIRKKASTQRRPSSGAAVLHTSYIPR